MRFFKLSLLCLLLPVFSACSTLGQNQTAADSASTSGQAEASPRQEKDPWESVNRKIFAFDMTLDEYLLKPAAKGYQTVTPDWGESMVHHFFKNLGDLGDSVNSLLQLKFAQAGTNLGRFLLNTTLGVGGLFDVATDANLIAKDQDFGLTLAHWGVDPGPYLVLPFLGPSTVRDAVGMLPDNYLWPPHYLKDDITKYGVTGLYGVSKRAELLGIKDGFNGDMYLFVRNYYLNSRAKAAGKEIKDTFGAGLNDDAGGWGDGSNGSSGWGSGDGWGKPPAN